MDSTSPKKFSRRVVVRGGVTARLRDVRPPNPSVAQHPATCFPNAAAAGCFAEQFVAFVRERWEQAPDGPAKHFFNSDVNGVARKPLVDLGVYQDGRCFRLLHSSKKAAGIPLRPLRHSTGTLPAHVGPKEYLLSHASFVGPVDTFVVPSPPQPGAAALALLVPAVPRALPARPPSSTLRNNALELFLRGFWGEVDKRWRAGATPFHEEEAHAAGLRAVQEGGVQDSCLQGLRPLPGGFVWELSLGRLYCGRRGRAHRNNRVKIHVNPGEQRAWQMCYDPDCRLYRGESFSVPGSFCRGF